MALHSLTVRMVQTARIRPRRHCAADSRAMYKMQMEHPRKCFDVLAQALCVMVLLLHCAIEAIKRASSVHVLSAILAMTSGKNEVTLAMISLQ